MPDPLLDPLLTRIAQSQQASMRIGTVTAIDATNMSLTASLAGEEVAGIRWIASYAPTVGDVVVASRAGDMWVVLGKLSKQLGVAPVVYGSVTITPNEGPILGGQNFDLSWWQAVILGGYTVTQGRSADYRAYGGAFTYPTLASQVPDGATITGVHLRLERVESWDTPGATLVYPRIYSHLSTGFYPSGPTWVAGPWSPGRLAVGQSASWPVPSAWVTAWLAGTINGLAVFSGTVADFATFSGDNPANGRLTITYTTPA